MDYNTAYDIIYNIPFDKMIKIYSNSNQALWVYRPSILSARFKNYDINKNFQIYLTIGDERPFRPNHLRLLIDLILRSCEMPETKDILLKTFDHIFYGQDPIEAAQPLINILYSQFINHIGITAVLAQLFIIEQNIGYGSRSTFDPPSLYIQGWIRTFINDNREIDQIIYRICKNTPPPVKYTCADNKNHLRFNPNAQPLWYK